MNIDIELYMILFLLYILLYNLFIDVYNKYYVKFIVVSNNKNNILKIHTKPISLTKALEIQKKLQDQYYHLSISGNIDYKKEAFIIKFIKYYSHPLFKC